MSASIVRGEVSETSFSFFGDDDIRALSTCRITSAVNEDALGNVLPGSLYDARLGPVEQRGPSCVTCGLSYAHCTGHCGHIELCVNAYHPLMFASLYEVLRHKCMYCHCLRMSHERVRIYLMKLLLIEIDDTTAARKLDDQALPATVFDDEDGSRERDFKRHLKYCEDRVLNYIKTGGAANTDLHARSLQRAIIAEFHKAALSIKGCENCGGHSPALRKDGFTKFFVKPLTKQALGKMKNTNHKLRTALEVVNSGHDILTDDGLDAALGDGDGEDPDEMDTGMAYEKEKYLAQNEVEAQIRLLWLRERTGLLDFIWGRTRRGEDLSKLYFAQSRLAPENGPSVIATSWKCFFLRTILVPPSRFRPYSHVGDVKSDHPQNVLLAQILTSNEKIAKMTSESSATDNDNSNVDGDGASKRHLEKVGNIITTWIELQNSVNCYMDSAKSSNTLGSDQGPSGIRQLLERKEGLFRKNMMGKRVNYCCRSVISPDPYLGTDEVGLPVRFAKTLHYPVAVTHWNAKHMRTLVENGPDIYPGANMIETAEGRTINLARFNQTERAAKAKLLLSNPGVKVYRHLVNGDVLLVNRQPTLHKPGIMAHKARILTHVKEETVRMHYANCNAYNADFDGDEINCHFVQDEIARAEANLICNTNNQYIVPTSGGPLRGLIQDHVASGVKLTCKGTFLNRAEFQQLLYIACVGLPGNEIVDVNEKLVIPPPTIFKPIPLWTGKQVIGALLKHLCKGLPRMNLDGKTRTPPTAFGEIQNEHKVIFRDSELLSGVLDKAAMGASNLGIVHAMYELYGADHAGKLLSSFCRLFTNYLQLSGHTCGVEDLTLTEKSDKERHNMLEGLIDTSTKGLYDYISGGPMDDVSAQKSIGKMLLAEGKTGKAKLDSAMQGVINKSASDILKTCLPGGLERPFPANNFSLMVLTGAKGSSVNQSQISCFLGQQALEGQRVPIMISGKSLPSFKAYDTQPRAMGFVGDRFLTGVRPQEYYFHCMAGREGLVDTAVKTSRSGYLQRCLVKHLEELRIHYDMTVRDSGSNVVQFLYGEDGLDPMGAALLGGKDNQLNFLKQNTRALAYRYGSSGEDRFDKESARVHFQRVASARAAQASSAATDKSATFSAGDVLQARMKQAKAGEWIVGNIGKDWHEVEVVNVRPHARDSKISYDLKYADGTVEKKVPRFVTFHIDAPGESEGRRVQQKATFDVIRVGLPDPAMSVLPLNRSLGAVSEKIYDAIGKFAEGNEESNKFGDLVATRFQRALAAPGDAVGCIAAQSIGEPSTQMTLNTFHLAGHGGANVTLGIPRLREIIMTASKNLKTPTMTIPIKDSGSETSVTLARKLSRVSLFDLLHHSSGVKVKETMLKGIGWERAYDVTLTLESPKRIKSAFGVSFQKIVDIVEKSLLRRVSSKISQIHRKSGQKSSDVDPLRSFRVGHEGGVGGRDDEDNGDVMESGRHASRNAVDYLIDGDDDDELEDEDAGADEAETGAGKKEQRKQNDAYDEGTDDESEVGNGSSSSSSSSSNSSSGSSSDSDSEGGADMDIDDLGVANGDDSEGVSPSKKTRSKASASGEINSNKHGGTITFTLTYPADESRVLMLEVVSDAAKEVAIKETQNISAAHAVETSVNGVDKPAVLLEGINFSALWQLSPSNVDHGQIKSNDIYHTLLSYGVEAARLSIVSEITGVFGVYGINVDPRHLSLVADYMTRNGEYVPMNRAGMHESSSPFLQMSFETTCEFLTRAICEGTADKMESSTSRIVLGSVPKVGTGCFDVMLPLDLDDEEEE